MSCRLLARRVTWHPLPISRTCQRCISTTPARWVDTSNTITSSSTATATAAASTPTTPPFLAKLKTDLKTAMRSKDSARLDVIRAVISSINNAAKTPKPVRTDLELVQLLQKMVKGSQGAVDEAKAAGRDDLVEKEGVQVEILNQYVADTGVKKVDEAELTAIIKQAVSDSGTGSSQGEVMKRLLASGGPLDGMDAPKGDVAKLVKQFLATASG